MLDETCSDRASHLLQQPGRRRLATAALFAALLLPGTQSSAAAAARAPLCLEAPAPAAVLGRLDAALWSARTEDGCAAPTPYHCRFEQRAGGVVFVLVPPQGPPLERELPWVSQAEGALAALDDAGRLSAFAVLVEGLLAEERLPAGRARAAPAGSPPAVGAPSPPGRTAGGPAPALTLQPAVGAALAAGTVPAGASIDPTGTGTKLGGGPSSDLALLAPARPAEPRVNDSAPTAPGVASLQAATPANRPALLAPELFAGLRARLPGLVAPELGGGLTLREFFLHAAYQPEARWSLDGPALAVSALSFLGGYRLALVASGPLELRGTVGLAVERLVVTELAAGSAPYSAWDAGAGAGAALTFRPAAQLGLGVELLGFWLPTGRSIDLPGGGVAHLNGAAARLAVTARWGE